MSQNVADFEWTEQREEAALLVAQDRISNEEIGGRVGVDRRTIDRWKTSPEFAARVEGHREAWRKAALLHGIADRNARARALNDRWNAMQQVIRERAADESMKTVPGGSTGLLVRQVKLVKVYEEARVDHAGSDGALIPTKLVEQVEEYAVDTGLLAEIRAHEKQAAQELGQWSEKREVSGDVLVRRYEGVPIEGV